MMLFILLCFIVSILSLTGISVIKSELINFPLNSFINFIYFMFRWKVLIGFILIGISALLQIKIISLMQISYAVPILYGIYFILTLIVGIIIFKEVISITAIIGIIFIIIGIIIMNFKL